MALTVQVPLIGQPNSTEAVKIANSLTNLSTWANGQIAIPDIGAALAQSAVVNLSGQTVKGVTTNAGPGTRTNVAYGSLSDAADQVGPLTLASNGWIIVGYKALASCSVGGNIGSVALFLDANQVVVTPSGVSGGPVSAQALSPGSTNVGAVMTAAGNGLQWVDFPTSNYTGDVTTGQLLGNQSNGPGIAVIFAAAGAHTVSVRWKSSSGTITASARTLWALALSFA